MLPNLRSLAAAALLGGTVMLEGCDWHDSKGGPVGNASPPPPSQAAATTSPTIQATVAPTVEPTPVATPEVFYEVAKAGEGGHGGPPLLDLPASIAIDYAVTGTCEFTIVVTYGVPDNGVAAAKLAMTVTGRSVSGMWPLTLVPGKYYVVPGEAVGCTFNVRVYAA